MILLINRDGTHYPVNIPGTFDTHIFVPPHLGIAIMKFVNPQVFHRSPRHSFQAGPLIYIYHINRGILPVRLDFIRYYRRSGSFAEGYRFQQGIAGLFLDKQHIIENIYQVYAPK